jgi:hypothetical protein
MLLVCSEVVVHGVIHGMIHVISCEFIPDLETLVMEPELHASPEEKRIIV